MAGTVTTLSNTTWYIPGGWKAEAGYGRFSLRYYMQSQEFSGELCIGYTGNFDNNFSLSKTDSVVITPSSSSLAPANSLVITITGGVDVQDTKLIAWLLANGVLLPNTQNTLVVYNKKIIASIGTDNSVNLLCTDLLMESDILVKFGYSGSVYYNGDEQGAGEGDIVILPCNGHIMEDDVIVYTDMASYELSINLTGEAIGVVTVFVNGEEYAELDSSGSVWVDEGAEVSLEVWGYDEYYTDSPLYWSSFSEDTDVNIEFIQYDDIIVDVEFKYVESADDNYELSYQIDWSDGTREENTLNLSSGDLDADKNYRLVENYDYHKYITYIQVGAKVWDARDGDEGYYYYGNSYHYDESSVVDHVQELSIPLDPA